MPTARSQDTLVPRRAPNWARFVPAKLVEAVGIIRLTNPLSKVNWLWFAALDKPGIYTHRGVQHRGAGQLRAHLGRRCLAKSAKYTELLDANRTIGQHEYRILVRDRITG